MHWFQRSVHWYNYYNNILCEIPREEIEIEWETNVFCREYDEALKKETDKFFAEAILLKLFNHEKVMKCFSY